MFSKSILALALLGSASAFAPVPRAARALTSRKTAEAPVEPAAEAEEEVPATPAYPTLNGWTADSSKSGAFPRGRAVDAPF